MQRAARQLRKWRVIHYASRHRATCLGMTAMGLVVCTRVLLSQRAGREDAFVQATMCPTPSMRCPALTQPSLASLPPHTEGQPEEHLRQEEQTTQPPRLFPHAALPPIAAPDARSAPLLRRPGSPRARDDNSPTDTETGDINVLITVVASHFVVRRETRYAVVSAYFTGLPIVVVGYGEEGKHNNTRKLEYSMRAVDRIGLRDSDVVMVLDSDVMFNGQDMLPYIDKFIAQSAASPSKLDAKAVREGRAMAPSVYSTETNCYCPQQYFCAVSACRRVYATMREAVRQYNKRHNCTPFARLVDKEEEKAEGRYVNTGTSIHRVWSLRRLNASMELYRQANPPQCRRVWKDDQTVVHVLYIELRYWELAQNALLSHAAEEEEGRRGGGRGEGQCAASAHPTSRAAAAVLASSRTPRPARGNKGNITGSLANTTRAVTTTSSVYGLLAGQIGFDVRSELAAVVPDGLAEAYELTSELWHDESPPQTLENVYDDGVFDFVDAVYRRNADRVNFTMRRFARNVAGTPLVMPFSPPMLVRRRRPASSSSSVRVFPPIVHYAGPRKRRTRTALLAHLPWSLSLRHNATQLQALREYLLPMPLHVFGYHKRHNLRFATGCSGGRFWRVGDQLSVKRTYVMFRGRQYDTKDN